MEHDPLPVLLLRRGPVAMREVTALHHDRRFELFVTDELTPEWVSLSQRVAGVLIATESDPLNVFGYAVTAGVKGPIVMMIGKRFQADAKDLVTAGATACVTMPVSTKDLDRILPLLTMGASLAHIDSTLRLLLDPVARSVRYHDKTIRLSQREFAVLQCMSSHSGRPVSAEDLLTYVWGESASANRPRQILDVYIFQLRQKLERLGLEGSISTVRGFGYCLGDHHMSKS